MNGFDRSRTEKLKIEILAEESEREEGAKRGSGGKNNYGNCIININNACQS